IAILADNENKKEGTKKVWTKNNLLNYFYLIKEIFRYKNTINVLIQFEWGVFGKNIFFVFFFPLFLFILRILGKKPIVVSHGVNFNFKPIFGKKLTSYLLNFGSYLFYFFTCSFAYKIVVTENHFKKELSKLPFVSNKIIFIPHGVDTNFKKQNKKNKSSKINLGYFGFLHPYKGPKILLDLFINIKNNNLSLSFFGGESPNLKQDRDYQKYLKKFYEKAQNNNITVTGFVDKNNLEDYFNKTNVVIFPYIAFISSSGMLSLTFSFEKPFILSRPLEGYFESEDFAQALQETGLKKQDFIFDLNKRSFEKRLLWAKNNLEKLSQFSKIMKQKRSWDKIAKKYLEILQ
ncbi:MAG: glycosyltransferase, partial [Microgenomates group bacterium]